MEDDKAQQNTGRYGAVTQNVDNKHIFIDANIQMHKDTAMPHHILSTHPYFSVYLNINGLLCVFNVQIEIWDRLYGLKPLLCLPWWLYLALFITGG